MPKRLFDKMRARVLEHFHHSAISKLGVVRYANVYVVGTAKTGDGCSTLPSFLFFYSSKSGYGKVA